MLRMNKTSLFVLPVSANQTSVMRKCLLLTMLTFAVALGFVQQAHAFTFITINNADGFPGFMAEGINGSGDIVGSSVGDRGGQCFVRDTKGTYTALNVPGAATCDATGINDLGQIVGFFIRTSLTPHGFLRDTKGTFTTIDVPGAISTQVFGINASGEIAGQFFDGSGVHGFLRDTKGTFRVINIASSTSVSGINDSGEFTGTIQGTSGIQGYLRDTTGTVTQKATREAQDAMARHGAVEGVSTNAPAVCWPLCRHDDMTISVQLSSFC